MTINKQENGDQLTMQIEGRLDTTTSPQLEEDIVASIGGIRELVLDLGKLEYISSAGLRVLLSAHKKMTTQDGVLKVVSVGETVMEVFEVTGFSDILNIE